MLHYQLFVDLISEFEAKLNVFEMSKTQIFMVHKLCCIMPTFKDAKFVVNAFQSKRMLRDSRELFKKFGSKLSFIQSFIFQLFSLKTALAKYFRKAYCQRGANSGNSFCRLFPKFFPIYCFTNVKS